MRRLILILALVVVATMVRGQTATFTIPSDGTYIERATDYLLTNTTASWFKIVASKKYNSTQIFTCILDSTSGNHTNIAVSLWGREFDTSSWTQIGSTVNSTAGTDTVTIINTSFTAYREFKFNYLGTGTGTSTIQNQEFKMFLH